MPHLAARLKKKQIQDGTSCVDAFACLGVWGVGSAHNKATTRRVSITTKQIVTLVSPIPHPKTPTPPTERQEAIDKENRRLLGQMLAVMDRDPNGAEGVSGKRSVGGRKTSID